MRIGAPLNHETIPALQWIEIASTLQLPGFHLVGLPSQEVNEAKERVRAAIESSGFEFPRRRLTLNLSPANVRKGGTGLDLAIALAVIQSCAEEVTSKQSTVVAWGELGLDGTVKPVGQVLRAVYACWRSAPALLIVSNEELSNARRGLRLCEEAEGAQPEKIEIKGVRNLREAWDLMDARRLELGPSIGAEENQETEPDLSPSHPAALMPLPKMLERLICVAASGSHHTLLLGPRGTGKSHALDWLSALQPVAPPKLRLRHRLISELRLNQEFAHASPIRRVNAQVKPAALLGTTSATGIRPGEFSLADGGLLIADEFPEWHRDSRECLREPLERGSITLARSQSYVELPASFTLAANGNLCPCGGWPPELPLPQIVSGDSPGRPPPRCRCGHRERTQYLARLSGPLLDRMDLVSMVLPPARLPMTRKRTLLEHAARTHGVLELIGRVAATREKMLGRWGNVPGKLPPSQIESMLKDSPDWDSRLQGSDQFSLRARHKVVRVALTLAAWDGQDSPSASHFMEAAMYRPERIGLCA